MIFLSPAWLKRWVCPKGTRISVEFIVDLLGRGWSIEQILKEYDHLKRDDIQACLAYAGQVLKSERVYLFPEKGAAGADTGQREHSGFNI